MPETPVASPQPLDDAKQEAAELADRAKQKGKSMLSKQKDAAAEQVGSMAEALHHSAQDLHSGEHSEMGRLADSVADRLESFSRELREKDLGSLAEEAQSLARRSPVAFFAGSVVSGFLLARFLKSSAERRGDLARVGHRSTRGEATRRDETESPAPPPPPEGQTPPIAPESAEAGIRTQPERAVLLGGSPTSIGASNAPR